MAFLLVPYVALLAAVAQASMRDMRAFHLAQIDKHELLFVDVVHETETTKYFELGAFGEHYKIKVTRNDRVYSPSFTSSHMVEEERESAKRRSAPSCHFSGTVMNSPSHSVVAVSMCEHQGLHARITAFGKTLRIVPSAWFLDLDAHFATGHMLVDEHMVYIEPSNRDHGHQHDQHREPLKESGVKLMQEVESELVEKLGVPNKRRLQQSFVNTDSGRGYTEMMLVVGPVRYQNFFDSYGSSAWYGELVAKCEQLINEVNALYSATNWGTVGGVGSINVVFAGLTVLESFTGPASNFEVEFLYSSEAHATGKTCNVMSDEPECGISRNKLLDDTSDWSQQNLDWTKFDDVQFLTDMWFSNNCGTGGGCGGGAGLAWLGTICGTNKLASGVNTCAWTDPPSDTVAHEMGHNFGFAHDGDTRETSDGFKCVASDGIMGSNDDQFSSCSITTMQNHNDDGGLSCLATGWESGDEPDLSQYEGVDPSPTAGPTTPTLSPSDATPSPTVGTANPTAKPSATPTARPTPQPVASGQTPGPTPVPIKAPTKSPTPSPTASPVAESDAECTTIGEGFTWSGFNSNYALIDTDSQGAPVSVATANGYTIYLRKYYGSTESWYLSPYQSESSGTSYSSCASTSQDPSECAAWSRYADSGSRIAQDCGGETCMSVSSGALDAARCVMVEGISNDYAYMNGMYEFDSCDANVRSVYAGDNGLFLCYVTIYGGGWMISDDANCLDASAADILALEWTFEFSERYVPDQSASVPVYPASSSGSYSTTYGGSWTTSTADCSSAALESTEQLCLGGEQDFQTAVCVENNNEGLQWSSNVTFEVVESFCAIGEAVFSFTVQNATSLSEDGEVLVTAGEAIELTYYLFYREQLKYVGGSVYTTEWVIATSTDETALTNAIAVCEQEQLFACTAGAWKVTGTSYDELGLDPIVGFFDDLVLNVRNGDCDGSDDGAEESGSDDDDEDSTLIVLLVLFGVVVVASVIAFCVCKKLSNTQGKQFFDETEQNGTEVVPVEANTGDTAVQQA